MAELQNERSSPAPVITAAELKVEVLESSFVKPSEETPKNTVITLSNLDLKLPYYSPMIYYFRRTHTAENFFSPAILKSALAKALVLFYPLAGKLVAGKDGQHEISCTGDGALFVVAKSENVLDDLGYGAPSLDLKKMLVPSTESDYQLPCTLVMFQVTFFECGGVCLGTVIHHTAADGYSSQHFMRTWCDIARGLDVVLPPSVDRSPLRARSLPVIRYDHVEYDNIDFTKRLNSAKSRYADHGEIAFLLLSNNNINTLKNIIKNTGCSVFGMLQRISTFRAVSAHVWRCACKARGLTGDRETRLYMPVDVRERVNPPLPKGYFGNGYIIASARASVHDITSKPIGFAASRIHETLETVTSDDYIRSLIDYIEVQKLKGAVPLDPVTELPETDFWVNSWMGLPVYGVDFGWGKPEFMTRTSLQFNGKAYFMKSPEEDGGVMVVVSFEPEKMALFKKALYEGLVNI